MNVHDDAPWKAPHQKFMDVGDVKVTDEDGLLSCSMMIKAMNTIMKERLLTNRVAGQLCSSFCIQTFQRDRLSAFAS